MQHILAGSHHHCYWAKQSFQIVRQFRSASVSRVHRDKHRTRAIQIQFCILEYQGLLLRVYGPLNGQDLLRHDRQDLQVDAVEFIEAGPRACAR